jgi:ABC-type branched-subunit amino acid transport system ATPase component
VGPSGAGKTTLLQILGTLDHPDSGSLRYGDTEVSNLKEKELARFRNEHIGFVFQAHHLLPEFSAEENVMIPALITGNSMKEARAKAEEELNALKAERAHAEMVAAVAAKTGVGADVVSMLTGDTAEELEAQVERLAGTIPAFPVRTDDGGGKAHAARTNGDVFAEQAARMFKQ